MLDTLVALKLTFIYHIWNFYFAFIKMEGDLHLFYCFLAQLIPVCLLLSCLGCFAEIPAWMIFSIHDLKCLFQHFVFLLMAKSTDRMETLACVKWSCFFIRFFNDYWVCQCMLFRWLFLSVRCLIQWFVNCGRHYLWISYSFIDWILSFLKVNFLAINNNFLQNLK